MFGWLRAGSSPPRRRCPCQRSGGRGRGRGRGGQDLALATDHMGGRLDDGYRGLTPDGADLVDSGPDVPAVPAARRRRPQTSARPARSRFHQTAGIIAPTATITAAVARRPCAGASRSAGCRQAKQRTDALTTARRRPYHRRRRGTDHPVTADAARSCVTITMVAEPLTSPASSASRVGLPVGSSARARPARRRARARMRPAASHRRKARAVGVAGEEGARRVPACCRHVPPRLVATRRRGAGGATFSRR